MTIPPRSLNTNYKIYISLIQDELSASKGDYKETELAVKR